MNIARTRGRPRGPAKKPFKIHITEAALSAVRKAAGRKNRSASQLFEDYVRRELAAYLPAETPAQ